MCQQIFAYAKVCNSSMVQNLQKGFFKVSIVRNISGGQSYKAHYDRNLRL